ncbi:MAG: hydrogenase [Gracilibacteraceae bacterium]|jgi:nitrogenase molybdenum-iron protein beta chain|nr:hydrogenase [Gracilibacteraceae bacterium]
MNEFIEQPRYVCALGSQQTVLGIPRSVPVVHAGPGCCAKLSHALNIGGEGFAGVAMIPCTNSTQNEVIFGGEDKLRETIDGALKLYAAELFVVLTGCTADIVGDDVETLVAEYRRRGVAIVNADTGGFKANNFVGHELVLKAIIAQLLQGAAPRRQKGLVNVFSVLPYQHPFWRGDLEQLQRLIESIGLKANILFGQTSAGAAEWRAIPRAEFSLVLSPWVGLEAAQLAEELFGVPYLHYPTLPVGALESSRFLRTLADFAGIARARVEKVVAREENWYYDYFRTLATHYTQSRSPYPNRLYSATDAAYALAFASYLVHELGFVTEEQFLIDDVPERYQENVREQFAALDSDQAARVVFETDGGLIHTALNAKKYKPSTTLFLGSSWERDLAWKFKGFCLEVSLPMHYNYIMNKSYLGYGGGLRFLEDLFTNIYLQNANAVRNRVIMADYGH